MLTTAALFLEKTSLLVDVLVEAVLAEKPHALTPAQVTWFAAYCDQRFRYFHANNPRWQKWLEDRDRKIDPRDQCKVWIRHWLAAYVLDPAGYQGRWRVVRLAATVFSVSGSVTPAGSRAQRRSKLSCRDLRIL